MTKYEWETELRKNIQRLPKLEQDKIFEYYNELFADKIELGRTEEQAITEFGNPNDVAYKIMNEYDVENSSTAINDIKPVEQKVEVQSNTFAQNINSMNSTSNNINENSNINRAANNIPIGNVASSNAQPQMSQPKTQTSTAKTVLFVIMIIIFGGLTIALAIVVGVIFLVYPIVMIALFASGIANCIVIGQGMAATLFSLGSGIMSIGLGLLMAYFIKKVYKGAIYVFKAINNLFFGWYYKKKEEII